MEALIERLDSSASDDMKAAIIAALGDLGPVAADAVPTLSRYADDWFWAREAQLALDRIR